MTWPVAGVSEPTVFQVCLSRGTSGSWSSSSGSGPWSRTSRWGEGGSLSGDSQRSAQPPSGCGPGWGLAADPAVVQHLLDNLQCSPGSAGHMICSGAAEQSPLRLKRVWVEKSTSSLLSLYEPFWKTWPRCLKSPIVHISGSMTFNVLNCQGVHIFTSHFHVTPTALTFPTSLFPSHSLLLFPLSLVHSLPRSLFVPLSLSLFPSLPFLQFVPLKFNASVLSQVQIQWGG